MSGVVILLSGGLDSALLLAMAAGRKEPTIALTVDYGQVARQELASAKRIAKYYRAEHVEIVITAPFMAAIGYGYYHPGRNAVLLSLASSLAEARGMSRVEIGACLDDAEDYPDCRADFVAAFSAASAVEVSAPLIMRRKPEIHALARACEVPVALTISCNAGTGCGVCPSCRLDLTTREGV